MYIKREESNITKETIWLSRSCIIRSTQSRRRLFLIYMCLFWFIHVSFDCQYTSNETHERNLLTVTSLRNPLGSISQASLFDVYTCLLIHIRLFWLSIYNKRDTQKGKFKPYDCNVSAQSASRSISMASILKHVEKISQSKQMSTHQRDLFKKASLLTITFDSSGVSARSLGGQIEQASLLMCTCLFLNRSRMTVTLKTGTVGPRYAKHVKWFSQKRRKNIQKDLSQNKIPAYYLFRLPRRSCCLNISRQCSRVYVQMTITFDEFSGPTRCLGGKTDETMS